MTPAVEATDAPAALSATRPTTQPTDARASADSNPPIWMEGSADCPALLRPEELEALRARDAETDFIRRWQRYGAQRTDAPPEFHLTTAIVLVATAIDRNRWLDLQHKRIYPSVYVLNLAESGQRKSTPLDYGVEAITAACGDRLLSNDYSPEALVKDLADRASDHGADRGASRGTAFIDEAGRLLGTMRRNHYGEGLKDLLNQLWDSPEETSRRLMKGTYYLHSVYVNLLMATTLTRFTDVATPEDVATGFLARFLPVLVKEDITRRPLSVRRPETDEAKQQLSKDLAGMWKRLQDKPGPVSISPDALARLDKLEEDLEAWATREFRADLIRPWARRLAEYGTRLSIIFAVSEGQEQIELPHVLRAVQVIARARGDVRELVEEIVKDQQARNLDRLDRFIRANPGISSRDLQRRSGMPAATVKALTDELKAQERIYTKPTGPRSLGFFPVLTVQ